MPLCWQPDGKDLEVCWSGTLDTARQRAAQRPPPAKTTLSPYVTDALIVTALAQLGQPTSAQPGALVPPVSGGK